MFQVLQALMSFVGGSVFRMVWGEVSSFFTKKQDHKHEIEKLRLQDELDAAQHGRNLQSIRVQAELGIKTIQVQADADIAKLDTAAWAQAVSDVGKSTGIRWLDMWNGSIRPFLATLAAAFLVAETVKNGWSPTEHVIIIGDAILGIYVADRSLGKRGK